MLQEITSKKSKAPLLFRAVVLGILILQGLNSFAAARDDFLTSAEREWLVNREDQLEVLFGYESPPNAFYDEEGRYVGLLVDYLHEIEGLLGITFRFRNFKTWDELINYARSGRDFIVVGIAPTPGRGLYLSFTDTFIQVPYVIVTRKSSTVSSMDDLQTSRVCTVANYAVNEYITDHFPRIQPHGLADNLAGLRAVSSGDCDAMILNQMYASDLIDREGITNLKIAGESGYLNRLAVGVSLLDRELLGIMEKTVSRISADRHRELYHTWVNAGDSRIPKKLIYIAGLVGACAALLLLLLWVWTASLKREVGRQVSKIRESEDRLRLALEAGQQGLYDFTVATGEVQISPEYATLLGYDPDDFQETRGRFIERLHPDEQQRVAATLQDYLLGKDEEFRVECRQRTRSGDWKWILSTGQIVERDSRGEPLRMIGTITDIGELKSKEEALKRQAGELSALYQMGQKVNASLSLEATTRAALTGIRNAIHPDMAFLFLHDGERLVMTDVLPKTARLHLGGIKDHLVGECICGRAALKKKPIYSLNIHEDSRCTWEECKQAGVSSLAALPLLSGNSVAGVIGLASYSERDFQLQGSFLETLAGQISVAIANSRLYNSAQRELTRRKQEAAEKEKLQKQLFQSQKIEAVGRLAGGVAHDFNNMLAAILGHTELAMLKCSHDEPVYGDLKVIEESTHRSAELVKQLLAFARKQTVAPRVLDVNKTVEHMLKMLRRLIGEDIDLVWQPGAELFSVKMDPSQLDQLLANLCVNARDAIGGVGKVTIETQNFSFDDDYCALHPGYIPGEYTMLAVSDDGCGMDQAVLNHLFEPFFTTKETGKGTGLGLATVYGIVRQNGGFVNVYSEPGQGSLFKIYLPRHQGKVIEQKVVRKTELPEGNGETILLVEDELPILKLNSTMLERLGYRVLAAATPGEAQELARDHADEIALLITDVIMPEMNGRDLADSISAIKPKLRCLFTSGYTANVIAHHGVLDDGVHFLQKPFAMKDLALKIFEILQDERA